MSDSGKHRVRSRHDAPRTRQCLLCKAAFHSEWSGERICKRCKSSSAWRGGYQATTAQRGGMRGPRVVGTGTSRGGTGR